MPQTPPQPTTIRTLLALIHSLGRVGEDLDPQLELFGATSDSREVDPGDLYIALPGVRTHGVDYLEAAFEAGCAAALVPEGAPVSRRYQGRCISAGEIRRNAALVSATLSGEPTCRLLTFGVTGTNGKTSSCHILRHILESCGHRVVMLSTVAQEFGDWRRSTPNTTPDAPLIQKLLARALAQGATAAVIEVSAHGVSLERILGCVFDGLLFTNLSLDHQDDFDGIEPYFEAKRRLFVDPVYHKESCVASIGVSDEFGRRLLADAPMPATGFGWKSANDDVVSASGLVPSDEGVEGTLQIGGRVFDVNLPLRSRFNCLNVTGAAVLAGLTGLDPDGIGRALVTPMQVPGRLMEVPAPGRPFRVIVDFANTESAMSNLLQGLREECRNRLIVVFGAGGDRDPGRRRTLPEVVVDLADVGVITLDNPRSEPPLSIVETMRDHWMHRAAGHSRPAELHVEADRAKAIEWAISEAGEGDIVVLAGKGHETTQIFADRIEPHSDFEVAAGILSRRAT